MFHVNEVEITPRVFFWGGGLLYITFFILDNFGGNIEHGRDDNDIEYDCKISFSLCFRHII